MVKERVDVKEERRKKWLENGEDLFDWDDSDYDGESWIGEGEEEVEIEFFGSEEENEDEEEEMEDGGVLIDDVVEEFIDEEMEEVDVFNLDDEDGFFIVSFKQVCCRVWKQIVVLFDDEDEVDEGVVKVMFNFKKILVKLFFVC